MVNVWHWISHRLHMLSGCHTRYSISLFTFHLRRFASYWVFYRLHFPECRLGSIILLHARSSFNAFQWNGIYCFRSLRTYRFSFIFEQYYSEFSLSRWIVPQKRPRSVGVTAAMRNLCTLSADELMCGVALTLDRDTYVECTERERERVVRIAPVRIQTRISRLAIFSIQRESGESDCALWDSVCVEVIGN